MKAMSKKWPMHKQHLARTLVLMVVSAVSLVLLGVQPAHADLACQNGGVYSIGARGTIHDSPNFDRAEVTALKNGIANQLADMPHAWAELGNLDKNNILDSAHEYPANGLELWPLLIGNDEYYTSVGIGATELSNYLNNRYANNGCPGEVVFLGGYSQGAEVIHYALIGLGDVARRHVAYAAFYGDTRNISCISGVRAPWARGGNIGCVSGAFGAFNSYVPADLMQRAGSWCDAYDGACTGNLLNAPIPGNFTTHAGANNAYTDHDGLQGWITQSTPEIAAAIRLKVAELNPGSQQLFHGPVPNGIVVKSTDSNLYVAAGGRLFWFDQNNQGMLSAFRAQMQAKYGTTSYPVMDATEVHAVEVNRTSAGVYSPGANMPADNTFLYEYGQTQQYVIKYQHPFAVADQNEVVSLGGQDRAVMVPPGLADLQTYPPQWVQNDLLLFGTDPAVWHYAGSLGYRVPGIPTRDCLMVRWNRGVTYMPASAWNMFPTHATQQAACDFTHGQWLFGAPSNRQVIVLYGVGHSVQYDEVAPLGGTNLARPVSDFTVDWLMARPLNLPAHHLFRAVNSPDVYMVDGGQFHLVGSPSTRNCLQVQYGVGVEVVPQSFVDKLPKGAGAQCAYEGRQLLGSGGSVDYVRDGSRHHVQNPAIRDCLIGRAGTGQPIAVDANTWNSYAQGADAYCPYEGEVGLNFVQEAGNPTVWLVRPPSTPGQPGVKQHVGSLCVPDPYTTVLKKFHVWTVPAGETAGHVQGADFWASGGLCGALPG